MLPPANPRDSCRAPGPVLRVLSAPRQRRGVVVPAGGRCSAHLGEGPACAGRAWGAEAQPRCQVSGIAVLPAKEPRGARGRLGRGCGASEDKRL